MPRKIVDVGEGQSENEAKAAAERAEETEGQPAAATAPRPELTVEPVDDLPGSPPADDVAQLPGDAEAAPPPPATEEPPAKAFGRKKRGLAKPAYEGPKARPIGATTDQSESSLATTARAASGEAGEDAASEIAEKARQRTGASGAEEPPAEAGLAGAGEEEVALTRIKKSPTNPRIKFEEIEKLADSIRKGFQIQAVLLRPNATLGGYEIADGERRVRAQELNAEKYGGPKTIRALIKPMADRDFDEIRLDANLQRKDLKPAEEAEAFQRLHKVHGVKYPDLAARFGLKPRIVYNRVQLLTLGPAGRKALDADEFNQSIMLEIARRPTPSVQEEMLRELRNRSITTLEAAEELFRVHFAFDLATAPFDKEDPFLARAKSPCAEAQKCSLCPHNSSKQQQLELGGKAPRPNICTSPDGFRAKRDAHVEQEKEKAKADGLEWLKPAEVKRAFEGGKELVPNGPYVSQDATVPEHPGRATWRKLLGADLGGLKVYAAPDAGGRVHRLLDRAEAVAKARATGALGKDQAAEASRDEAAELKKRRQADAREAAAALKVVEAAVAEAEKALTPALLRATCLVLLDAMKTGPVEKRRGREVEHLRKELAKMKEPQLRGLLVELAFAEYSEFFTPELLALAKVLGLERKKLEKEVEQAELALKAKGKDAAAPPAEKPPKRGKRAA